MANPVNESLEMISGVSQKAGDVLSNIVIAVLILLLGLIIGKLLGNLIRRALNEIQLDKYFRTAVKVRFSLEKFIGNLVSYVIYFIAAIMSLNKLGLTTAIVTIITAIIVLVIVLSFLLAVKDFFPNLIGGARVKTKKLFKEGDNVQIREVRGRVTYSGLLETRLITPYDEEVIIPNSVFNKRQVIVRRKSSDNKGEKKAKK